MGIRRELWREREVRSMRAGNRKRKGSPEVGNQVTNKVEACHWARTLHDMWESLPWLLWERPSPIFYLLWGSSVSLYHIAWHHVTKDFVLKLILLILGFQGEGETLWSSKGAEEMWCCGWYYFRPSHVFCVTSKMVPEWKHWISIIFNCSACKAD
jgi:hypothetical protein